VFVLLAVSTDFQPVAELLTASEKNQARSFRQIRDQSNFAFARSSLRGLLGTTLPAADFSTLSNGRPYISGAPAFNISHTGEIVSIAVAPRSTDLIGIDLESKSDISLTPGLIDRVCHPEEKRYLEGLPEAQRSDAFAICWTRKEALLKATGEGIGEQLPRINVRLAEVQPVLGDKTPFRLWTVQTAFSQAHCTLAIRSDTEEIVILNLARTLCKKSYQRKFYTL
jgi:phosphopantetheinyl transferase